MSCFGKTGLWVLLALLMMVSAGCSNRVMDPAQIGRFRPTPAVNVILDSLGVVEEDPVVWDQAEEPKPADLMAVKGDYALQAGDVVRISIFELFQDGITFANDFVISETGKVSIPGVGVIQAAGLTETQLEEEIKEILSPAVLKDPSVTAVLISSQQRTFSILGDGVPQPSRYPIPRGDDFRLTEALATAGGPMQFNVSYIYVARAENDAETAVESTRVAPTTDELELVMPGAGRRTPIPGPPLNTVLPSPVESDPQLPPRDIPEPSQPAEKHELKREMLDMISPYAGRQEGHDRVSSRLSHRIGYGQRDKARNTSSDPGQRLVSPLVLDGAADPGRPPVTQSSAEGRTEWVFREGRWVEVPVQGVAEPPSPATQGRRPAEGDVEWVLRDNRWVQVRRGQSEPNQAPAATEPTSPSRAPEELMLPGQAEWAQAINTRLIKIPARELLAGNPRYNIVIKPGDTIHVPVDIIGEFSITGNVNRGGIINLTGRPMTLKMAIAAAGGLGPLAWPKYCEVIRRIGDKKEEIVMVDLDKIAKGEQPDFFIKPNDLINVGTHPTSRFRAVLRNAFRAAYGFGFVYDRNFAYSEDRYGTSFF